MFTHQVSLFVRVGVTGGGEKHALRALSHCYMRPSQLVFPAASHTTVLAWGESVAWGLRFLMSLNVSSLHYGCESVLVDACPPLADDGSAPYRVGSAAATPPSTTGILSRCEGKRHGRETGRMNGSARPILHPPHPTHPHAYLLTYPRGMKDCCGGGGAMGLEGRP